MVETSNRDYLVERTRDDIDTANRQWRHALSLKKERSETEAVAYCRDRLGNELERWPRGSTTQSQTFLVRCCFVQLLRLWAADILENEVIEIGYSEEDDEEDMIARRRKGKEVMRSWSTRESWEDRMRRTDHEPILVRCVTVKLNQNRDAESLETATLVLCFCLQFLPGVWAKSCAFKLLPKLEEFLRPDYRLAVMLVQYLAESILFDRVSWREVADQGGTQILERHSMYLEQQTGNSKISSLCFWFNLGWRFLTGVWDEQDASKARPLLRLAFKRRVDCLGESHAESDVFVEDLIDEICTKHTDNDNDEGLGFSLVKEDPHAIITVLLDHCYKTERFVEAEVLIRECLSHEGIFPPIGRTPKCLELEEGSVQYTVTSHGAPGECVHWEDSRTYLKRWSHVTFEPVFPPEFFPMSPIQLTAWPDRIDIALSKASRDDLSNLLGLTSQDEILKEIRSLPTWSYMELIHSRGILRDKIWRHERTNYPRHNYKRGKANETIAEGRFPIWPSIIWLLPEHHFTVGPLERAVSSSFTLYVSRPVC